uniref:Uncharacterized protein n=1 Tax=Myoviridae sp. ctAys2 TaxID=2825044 RepID=A0A8S5Q4F3_9CAUD|nr:MAG TPA: hypothetical protein [Myoviridae sp. ctAys2]
MHEQTTLYRNIYIIFGLIPTYMSISVFFGLNIFFFNF